MSINSFGLYRPLPSDGDGEQNGGAGTVTTGTEPWTAPASQDEFNRIISERLGRERAKFGDYNDLKTKAKRLDDIEAANATELEKAVNKARLEGTQEGSSKANAKLVASEARALASEAKFLNPTLATRALDLRTIAVTDDGEVDSAAIKAQLADLAKDNPYLIDAGKSPAPKPDPHAGSGDSSTSKSADGKAEAARRFGPKS